MPQAFGQLGQIFSSNPLGGGLGLFGLIGNIMAQQKQNAALNKISYYQNNPAAAAKVISSLTQPLTMGLTQDVGNSVQGYLGERGLSQSPNITAEVLSQSLAPYVQQNQQQAEQEFMGLLNPAGATFQQPANLAPLMKLLYPNPTGYGGGVNPGVTPGTTPQTFPGNDYGQPAWGDYYGGSTGGDLGGTITDTY
jgi:hypothetical protein